jgi:hypothetical protein
VSVDVSDARGILPELPDPSPERRCPHSRPERMLAKDQVDRFELREVMDKRAGAVLQQRLVDTHTPQPRVD